MKKINITETVLRDANQSLMATRMPSSDFEAVLETMDQAGYHSLECWGGATFDSCLRYLDEDPWDRLRKIKSKVKKTKLQMLLRGQNILGYKNYPDDIVRLFVAHAVDNGMDIIRIFDALNDPRNLEVAVSETKKRGAEAQGTICFTTSPVHTLENNVKLGKRLADMGCDSIAIKDMAGIMSPREVYDLVKALSENVKLPIVIHTHCTTGLGPMTYLKAVEAGASGIDCAISAFSGGTSQPATESMAYALDGMGFETGLDFKVLKNINDFFKPVKEKAIKAGLITPYLLGTETDALVYQVPGGMLSNLVAQLTAQNAMNRFGDALEEMPRVRKDLGYPPLVTPTSQMVGVQAVTNVLVGERYKNISKEVKAYIAGEYGKAPGEVDPGLISKVLGDEKPITCRPADLLKPAFEKAKSEIGEKARNDEDVLSYVAFPQVAESFFDRRAAREKGTVKYSIRKVE
ncbi:MAG: pyruvate carboxylase subunit B [Bacillota bacterium]|nr:pyruvate carboxylase subunit B [Bacillota bacterium]